MKHRKIQIFPIVIAAVLAAALSSAATAMYLMGGFGGTSTPLQKYTRLESIRQIVEQQYYKETDDDTLLNGALKGMLASLDDPYTYYITPDEAQVRSESESRSYYGLGMTVRINDDGVMEVTAVSENTPAETAGVIAGDLITAVDGTEITGMDMEESVALMRKEENEEVCLTIVRGDETMNVTLKRDDIPISNVSYAVLDQDIGYIAIAQFAGTDVEDFSSALETLKAENIKGLIIDLRGNPGGYLDHVTAIADMLLPEALIVYTQDRSGKRVDHYSDEEYYDVPLCVLVDGNSASASEILTAAIKDNGRGTVIGTQTYGKGIVQSVYTFEDDGAAIQFTSATYYTPNGVCIHGTGITPDIVEEDTEKQLQIAIDTLTGDSEN